MVEVLGPVAPVLPSRRRTGRPGGARGLRTGRAARARPCSCRPEPLGCDGGRRAGRACPRRRMRSTTRSTRSTPVDPLGLVEVGGRRARRRTRSSPGRRRRGPSEAGVPDGALTLKLWVWPVSKRHGDRALVGGSRRHRRNPDDREYRRRRDGGGFQLPAYQQRDQTPPAMDVAEHRAAARRSCKLTTAIGFATRNRRRKLAVYG